jgi:outer membrane lipoprotein LolB
VRLGYALALAACLTACSHLPAPAVVDRSEALPSQGPVEAFRLEGRLSVRAGEQSFSASLIWLRRPGEEILLLSTPLGQGMAEIRREADGMRLTDAEGKTHVAESGEALLARVVGIQLPVAGLASWLSARPHPDAPFTASLDAEGRMLTMEQEGWRIEYGRYRLEGGRWLPGKIFARREEGLEFRLVVDAWEPL